MLYWSPSLFLDLIALNAYVFVIVIYCCIETVFKYNVLISFQVFFLKTILSNIRIDASTYTWFPFTWSFFFNNPLLSTWMCLVSEVSFVVGSIEWSPGFHNSAAPLSIQLPVNGLGKAPKDGPSTWALPLMLAILDEASDFGLFRLWALWQSGSEQANESFSLSPCQIK